jgi:hypothetical protein
MTISMYEGFIRILPFQGSFFLSPWPVTEVALRFTDTEGGVVPAEVPQGEDVAAPWGPRP